MHDSGQRICLFSRSLELKIFALCERLNSNRHKSLLLSLQCPLLLANLIEISPRYDSKS